MIVKMEEIKNVKSLMIAQFIEVIDGISQCNSLEDVKKEIINIKKEYAKMLKNVVGEMDFFDICLKEEFIKAKLEKGKEVYSENGEINEVELAYKIGLIDGMKIK